MGKKCQLCPLYTPVNNLMPDIGVLSGFTKLKKIISVRKSMFKINCFVFALILPLSACAKKVSEFKFSSIEISNSSDVAIKKTAPFCNLTDGDFQDLLLDNHNRIYQTNNGGLFNGGVCWWHSRLQRASLQLVYFSPNKAKQNFQTIKKIIRHLVHMDQVVEITGYNNFNDFSRENGDLIQSALDAWQIRDGFLNMAWIKGLKGNIHKSPKKIVKILDRIFFKVMFQKKIEFLKVQLPGIYAHALLVQNVEINNDGYYLKVIDSNRPEDTYTIHYQIGDRSMYSIHIRDEFMVYDDYDSDLVKISAARNRFCTTRQFTNYANRSDY